MTYPIHAAVLAPQGVLGNLVSGIGSLLPFSAQPMLVPQSAMTDAVAPAVRDGVQAVVTHYVNPVIGHAAGAAAGALAQHIPFPEPGHTGPVGNAISVHAPGFIQAAGTAAGYPTAAIHGANIVREGARYLPFSAMPAVTLAPQGVFGSLIGAVAPTLGHAVGGLLGNASVGQQIGTVAGHLGGLLPFSAQPQVALAPQGVFGSLIGAVAPTLGHAVGGLLGNASVGQQIGTVAGHLGGLLPFSAQPQLVYA
ncbi:hypothetical protein [Cupriavidus sp. MP-37]|uniref:hypothetical protein n=1 Tax=Cupriavidus sp. MP-37 TaxID=2884455 RepID=UPI001D0AA4C8|nr:hypothetical protein [Cupriavidus sp. MP-37]UDM51385.1 hypothetical protein LIN44_06225 [Cupriavidus sp. MP-37]